MMPADTLVRASNELAINAKSFLAAAREAINATQTTDEIKDVRARIAAARAWAKTHRKITEIRRELLMIEVAALVKAYQLGADLDRGERDAAEWLSVLTEDQRTAAIDAHATTTTAVGLARALRAADEERGIRIGNRNAGKRFISDPEPPPDTVPVEALRRNMIRDARDLLRELLDRYTSEGEPFDVDSLAAELVATAGAEIDDDFMDGVREMCRTAIRNQPTHMVDGTIIPKLITARGPAGGFIRIPTTAATIANLDESLALRQEQLAQDVAALERFQKFVDKVRSIPGANPAANVGDLILQSIGESAA